MSEPVNWKCPFCNRDTTVTGERLHVGFVDLNMDNVEGPRRLYVQFIVCPNRECRRFTLGVLLLELQRDVFGRWINGNYIQDWQLVPSSSAIAFPNYVPKSVRDDYGEACAIRKQSPRASATLARRCLQGVLRDFWKVKPGRLVEQIDQIKEKIDPLTWQAIDAVRKVGNIGVHMEKDIGVMVEVDPNEAQLLIGLIETLIRDWYIAREERKNRLKEITAIAEKKEQAKQEKKNAQPPSGRRGEFRGRLT